MVIPRRTEAERVFGKDYLDSPSKISGKTNWDIMKEAHNMPGNNIQQNQDKFNHLAENLATRRGERYAITEAREAMTRGICGESSGLEGIFSLEEKPFAELEIEDLSGEMYNCENYRWSATPGKSEAFGDVIYVKSKLFSDVEYILINENGKFICVGVRRVGIEFYIISLAKSDPNAPIITSITTKKPEVKVGDRIYSGWKKHLTPNNQWSYYTIDEAMARVLEASLLSRAINNGLDINKANHYVAHAGREVGVYIDPAGKKHRACEIYIYWEISTDKQGVIHLAIHGYPVVSKIK